VLRASESRYRIAFQTSMDAMSITRFSDGVYLDVNEAALNGFGFTREEFIGRTADELNIFVDREDRKRTRDLLTFTRMPQYRIPNAEKGGETFWRSFPPPSSTSMARLAC